MKIRWIIDRQIQKQIVNHVRYTIVAGILTRFYNKFFLDLKNEKVQYPGKPQQKKDENDQPNKLAKFQQNLPSNSKRRDTKLRQQISIHESPTVIFQKYNISDLLSHQATKFGIVMNRVDIEDTFKRNPKVKLKKFNNVYEIADLLQIIQNQQEGSSRKSSRKIFGDHTDQIIIP